MEAAVNLHLRKLREQLVEQYAQHNNVIALCMQCVERGDWTLEEAALTAAMTLSNQNAELIEALMCKTDRYLIVTQETFDALQLKAAQENENRDAA
jgi:hypothetical protein